MIDKRALPEPPLLLDSTVFDAGLPLLHAVFEVALDWLRQVLQITPAEADLVFTRVIYTKHHAPISMQGSIASVDEVVFDLECIELTCCPDDLLHFLSYGPSKLICCGQYDQASHAKDAKGEQNSPRSMAEH